MTNMKLIPLLTFLWLLSLPFYSFGQKWEKYIDKYNKYYQKGDFEKALKFNEKLRDKSRKKLGQINKYIPFVNMNDAKLSLQEGLLVNVEKNVNEALEVSRELNSKDAPEHARLLLQALDLYLELGQYRLAQEALSEYRETFGSDITDDQKAKLLLIEMEILKEKGFYNEAATLLKDNIPYFSLRMSDKSIKKDQKELRNRQFAHGINIAGEAFIKKGDFQSADSTLKTNTSWIEDNLDKGDPEYAIHELLIAKSLDNQKKYKEAEKLIEDAYSHAKKGRDEHDRFVLLVHKELALAYSMYDKKGRYFSEQANFEALVHTNYPKNSVFSEYNKLIKIDAQLEEIGQNGKIQLARSIVTNFNYLPKSHVTKILANHFIYEQALKNKDPKTSLEAIRIEKEYKKDIYGEDSPEYHKTLIEEGIYKLKYTNDILSIDSIFKTSWQEVLKSQMHYSHPMYVRIQNNLASFYEETDRYDLAEEALDNAFLATTKTYERTDIEYANEIVRLANLQINLGEYKKAEQYLDLALVVLEDKRKEEGNAINYINALQAKARLYVIKGMYDEAEDLFYDIHKFVRKSDMEHFDFTVSREEMAKIYLSMGFYADARETIYNSISDKEEKFGAKHKSLIEPNIGLGRIQLISGDYTEAEKTARRTQNIVEEIYGDHTSKEIPGQILLADIYTTIGDFEKAETSLIQARDLHLKIFGEKHLQLAEIYSRLALVQLNLDKDISLVKETFSKSEEIVKSELDDDNPLYAELLKKKAYAYIQNEEYGEAFNLLLSAEEIWTKKVGKRNNINAAGIYMFLGDIYYMLKNYSEADLNYNKARRMYERHFSDQHPEYVKSLAKLSKVEYMQDDHKGALKTMEEVLINYNNFIKNYFPALSEREKARFWNTIKEDFEFFNTLVINRIDDYDDKLVADMYNNALNTKALLLNSSIKMRENILNSGDQELIEKYNDWLESKELLTQVLSMSLEELLAYQINQDSLVRVVELLEKDLSERSELFSANTDSYVTWENVKSVLKENQVAIEMVRFRHFDHVFTDSVVYAVLTLKNESRRDRPELTILRDGKNLENKYFKYYKNMIVYQMTDSTSYHKFWQPIEEKVGQHSTIFLSPDGVYNQINLETMMVDEGKYVLDNSNIVLVSNTKELYTHNDQKPNTTKDNRALMFGDPEFYVSTQPKLGKGRMIIKQLPGTKEEITSVDELLQNNGWQTDYYLEVKASEDQIKLLDNPKVFHIATHGFYTPGSKKDKGLDMGEINEAQAVENPLLRSGLMLKGAGDVLDKTKYNYNIESGILTAYEAMNLNLDYTDLVVLSACETGVGDVTAGEGVYGLQRAFLVAGAKTLIMSLFNVSDQATNELMVSFYEKWLSSGNMRESFIQAKKEIRTKYQEPIYWGSFIMFGLE